MSSKRHARGFTLLELMIVIAIVSILAAFAYPSYLDSVRKGRRADAMTSLITLQMDQERYRVNNSSYASSATADLGWDSSNSLEGHYSIAINGVSATGFTAIATPLGDQQDDTDCAQIAINQDGPDLANTTNASCWSR